MKRNTTIRLFILWLMLWGMAKEAGAQQSCNIYFNRNDSLINAAGRQTLDSLISTGLIHAGRRFSVLGHAFEEMSTARNESLARRRAAAVDSYLRTQGIYALRAVPWNWGNNGRDAGRNHNYAELVMHVGTAGSQNTVSAAIDTTPLNGTFALRDILFIDGKDTLLSESEPVLEELHAAMSSNPRLKLKLEGHVCCGANDAAGKDLSLRRAKAIADYLLTRGISVGRLQWEGFGFARPVRFPERSPADKKANRRVEARVLAR